MDIMAVKPINIGFCWLHFRGKNFPLFLIYLRGSTGQTGLEPVKSKKTENIAIVEVKTKTSAFLRFRAKAKNNKIVGHNMKNLTNEGRTQ
jgi:hypothetical protein